VNDARLDDWGEAAPMDSTFGRHAIFFSGVNHWHQLEVSAAFEQLIWIGAWDLISSSKTIERPASKVRRVAKE
jgi:hypothetical protein